MKDADKNRRHAAITDAAYALLAEHGYAGASMLRIAKAAKASNETLYRWYGNKDGLFKRMVEDNAAETKHLLQEALQDRGAPLNNLKHIAPVFLTMLLGDRAILLNRAAAADPSGDLGTAISAGGRDQIMPLFSEIIRPLCAPTRANPEQTAGWFLGLLVGDLQVRRIIHQAPAPSAQEIALRCESALKAFLVLTGPHRT